MNDLICRYNEASTNEGDVFMLREHQQERRNAKSHLRITFIFTQGMWLY